MVFFWDVTLQSIFSGRNFAIHVECLLSFLLPTRNRFISRTKTESNFIFCFIFFFIFLGLIANPVKVNSFAYLLGTSKGNELGVVVNLITVNNFAFLFGCTMVGRA